MRRRLLLLASFTGSLVACASLLGDFDVEPSGSNPDGSVNDDGGSSSGSSGEGGTTDSGSDGGPNPDTAPIGLQVATSTSATCATVQYPSKRQVTYCWGAQGAKYPFATVGANTNDPNVDGFFRPRLPAAETKYLTFSYLTGAGTGEWFVGRGSDGLNTATYAWGSNDNGECAAGQATPVMPTVMRLGSFLLQFDTIYAGPNHGCMVQNQGFYCWGNNAKCELRSGGEATCNGPAELPILADKVSRVVEDESSHPSGMNGPVVRMAGGLDHSCRHVRSGDGANADDDVECWGNNLFGQADPNSPSTFVDKPTPTVKVKRSGAELVAGENHVCAITGVSSLSCWGKNDSGQANPANKGAKAKPSNVAITGALSTLRAAGDLSCVVAKVPNQPSRAHCWGNGPKGRDPSENDLPVAKVAGIQDVTQLAIGRAHACAVAKKEGAGDNDPARVWCWGTNDFKRVDPRAATTQQILQPVEVKFPPEPAN